MEGTLLKIEAVPASIQYREILNTLFYKLNLNVNELNHLKLVHLEAISAKFYCIRMIIDNYSIVNRILRLGNITRNQLVAEIFIKGYIQNVYRNFGIKCKLETAEKFKWKNISMENEKDMSLKISTKSDCSIDDLMKDIPFKSHAQIKYIAYEQAYAYVRCNKKNIANDLLSKLQNSGYEVELAEKFLFKYFEFSKRTGYFSMGNKRLGNNNIETSKRITRQNLPNRKTYRGKRENNRERRNINNIQHRNKVSTNRELNRSNSSSNLNIEEISTPLAAQSLPTTNNHSMNLAVVPAAAPLLTSPVNFNQGPRVMQPTFLPIGQYPQIYFQPLMNSMAMQPYFVQYPFI